MSMARAGVDPGLDAAGRRGPDDAIVVQAARERIELYSLLAALMRKSPDAGFLARLAEIDLPATDHDDPDLIAAWRGLRRAARTADPDAVDDEFHRLFIGLGRGEVLPYASWYLSGGLMDRSLVTLRADLARLAITRRAGNREPEDHASALCEAMALLADPAKGVSLAAQRNFLSTHITPWMGRLFADVAAADGANFYRPVAALGAAFLVVEQFWLELP